MIEETQIREHMEVCDASGRHIGTVDHVEGGQVKLTRKDSADDRYHYIETSAIDRADGDRLILRGGAETRAMSSAEAAAASDYHAEPGNPLTGSGTGSDPERPLFGTSGTGTGMGGSGSGQN